MDDPGLLKRIIHADDRKRVMDHLRLPPDHFSTHELQFRIIRQNGDERWIGHVCQPVYDIAGEWLGYRASNRDITERKQAEAVLAQSETFYRAMFEKNRAVKLLIDPQHGTIIDANQAACDFYGYDRATFCTLHICAINILPPEQIYQEMHQALIEQRIFFEFRHRLKSGEIRDVEVYSSPIEMYGRTLLFSIVHDVSKRKRAEQSLQVQHQLTTMLSNTSDLTEGLNLVLDTVLQLEGVDCGGIYLVDQQQGSLDLVVHRGLSECFLDQVSHIEADAPQAETVKTGRPIYQSYTAFPFVPSQRRHEDVRAVAILPIKHHQKLIAVLNLGSHSLDAFSLPTRELLEAIAAQIGSTIVRITTEVALKRNQHNLQTLFNTLDDLLFIVRMDGTLIHVNAAVEQHLGYTREELLCRRVVDMHPPEHRQEVLSIFQDMINGKKTFCLVPLMTKTGELIPVETRIVTGIWDGQDVICGISRDITERKKAELALQRANERLAQGNERLRQQNQDMLLLNDMSDQLQACTNVKDAYTVIAGSATQLFAGLSGTLYIRQQETTRFVAVTHWGDAWNNGVALEQSLGQMHQAHSMTLSSARHRLCVPLVMQGETFGIIHLDHDPAAVPEHRHRWQQLANTMGRQIALALHNLMLREKLQQQAIQDPLTGLYNRRYLDEMLPRELLRAARQHQPVGVIMLDIDHFKRFNDTYGHDAGDVLLRAIGGFLRTSIRGDDIACRYGGEEFTLVLPGTSLQHTRQRAEDLRAGIRTIVVPYQGQTLHPVTASLGVAIFADHGDNADALIKAADQALYQAKRNGRDQVVVQTP
ncbi:MAG: diguanylate cyclase [Chloroflexaceae bacterium]|nr:diguanylate cyclase [Chloroflexaceae bacterium]